MVCSIIQHPCSSKMPRLKQIDEEISFRYKDQNDSSLTSSDDNTIHYSLTNMNMSMFNTSKESPTIISETSHSLLVGKIPLSVLSRAVETNTSLVINISDNGRQEPTDQCPTPPKGVVMQDTPRPVNFTIKRH